MRALIFAAGKGERMRPLSLHTPKPLLSVGGKPLIVWQIEKLAAIGVGDIVINTSWLAAQFPAVLGNGSDFGVHLHYCFEGAEPLETGGGLKKAAAFFEGGESFFACNSDVYSEGNLQALYSSHLSSGALATLAVRQRPSKRRLLFDGEMRLKGREGEGAGAGLKPFAFSGIQVISPVIFSKMSETGVFSITGVYLRLASAGEKINGCEDISPFWCDIGDLERLESVRLRAAAVKPF